MYFIYLDCGANPSIELEIYYSISTLMACGQPHIILYTDKAKLYQNYPVDIIDISSSIDDMTLNGRYIYRAKPVVLLDALKKTDSICTFVDSDTFIKAGFIDAIQKLDKPGLCFLTTARHTFELHEASDDLQSCDRRFTQKEFIESNSGIISARSSWGIQMLEEAISIIDENHVRGQKWRTLEQYAISKAVAAQGLEIAELCPTYAIHYCVRSQKRYMHRQIMRVKEKYGNIPQAHPPSIKLTPWRIIAFNHWLRFSGYYKTIMRQ